MELTYPALYSAADAASGTAQGQYLGLLRAEYLLLIVAAVMSLGLGSGELYYIASALVFIAALILLLIRTFRKPEQDWYKCRALAESIKTSTWRYAMGAEPFLNDGVTAARAEFRNLLKSILSSNRHIGHSFTGLSADGDQVTAEMEAFRALPLADRQVAYQTERIASQRTWYAKKAGWNKRRSAEWTTICVAIYVVATVLVLLRIAHPDWRFAQPDPLIAAAAAIIGWMQIKKFNELAASYTLTAHEIGIIQGRLTEVSDEAGFSDFVNEAELAFSREHTQWVARYQNG